ncbi:Methionyl-tRNA formyltransferase [hydrothermal vent metagenome]|uniref:Methionyl-tRNA formyltransferase n=1 Tax=hydrothermal vent metagenome TaxID=652676 RepID=A0A3B0VJK0_9ZZZZ
MRILFFGMLGTLSKRPLSALLSSDNELCGLLLPTEIVPPFRLLDDGRSPAPITPIRPEATQHNLLQGEQAASPLAMAAAQGVPAFAVQNLTAAKTLTVLAELQPDVICVSCFPHRLPPAILNLPPLGCLNVHPSLLPRFRGPAPLFWALRAGVRQTGVTVHVMDAHFDTGDVALQRPFPLQDGVTHAEIEHSLAELGGELLQEAIRLLALGRLPRQPQPLGLGSDPWPGDADFGLDTAWSAQRAFNFMRGTRNWERPYSIQVNGEIVWMETAVSYQSIAQQPQPIIYHRGSIFLQFSPGILQAVKK